MTSSRICLGVVILAVACFCHSDAPAAPLHDAVQDGDAEKAEEIILAGADVDERDEETFSPLEYAALTGQADLAELLLQHGADVNARDEQGIAALHIAVASDSLPVTGLLIEHGAEVDASDNEGYTALHIAAMAGSARIAELLINHGADVNAENAFGRTPLNEASDAGERRVIRLLERHGGVEGEDARLPFEPEAEFVVIDRSEPAFLVMTGVSQDTPADELEALRARVADQESATMLTWDEFVSSANEMLGSFMLISEYPEFRIVDSLVCLVGTQPGAPWGLTWNGGIALTMNDYNHTRRRYEQYQESPGRVRRLDPSADPVFPGHFLMFFGCM